MTHLRSIIAVLLAALIASLGVTAAMARGQTRIDGQVILCSGAIYQPGDDGTPAHICPDMALGLLAALADAPQILTPPTRAVSIARPPSSAIGLTQAQPATNARGPPPLI